MIRMRVKPSKAALGIVMLPVTVVAGTHAMFAVAPLLYTFSPASVNKPLWLKSMKTAKPLE